MAETLSTYLVKCQQECDDTSTGASAVLNQRIKEVVQEVLRQTKEYLLSYTTNDRTATAGTAVYTPSDFVELFLHYKTAGGTDFERLEETNMEDYLNNYINTDDGTPTKFLIDGLSYRLIPAPSDAGTIRETYQSVQADLTATSPIPERFTNVVVLGVTARFKEWENNLNASMIYQQKYQSALRDMILELSSRVQEIKPSLY